MQLQLKSFNIFECVLLESLNRSVLSSVFCFVSLLVNGRAAETNWLKKQRRNEGKTFKNVNKKSALNSNKQTKNETAKTEPEVQSILTKTDEE